VRFVTPSGILPEDRAAAAEASKAAATNGGAGGEVGAAC